MKRLAGWIGFAGLGALLLGVPVLAQDISIDYDHHFKFNQMKSYSWGKIEGSDPLVEARIPIAIDRVLQGYGFKESNKEKKGDLVVTAIEANSARQYVAFYRGMGSLDWHRGWGGGGFADGTTTPRQIHSGTLIVDIYNPATGKLVWRGTAAEGNPAKTDSSAQTPTGYNTVDAASVDKSVNTMFANYPPKSGGPLPPNQHEVKPSDSSIGLEGPN